MDREQKSLLKKIMELDFAVVETNLYLDTHPCDERALRLHNTLVKKADEVKCLYECKYGPIKGCSMSKYPWQYIKEPWPWDMEF
ncbi:MAG: spore coat protein CotJB [Clostridiales bacterium]|nr:spore coat protein CotJB [Clostridiales bacterium]